MHFSFRFCLLINRMLYFVFYVFLGTVKYFDVLIHRSFLLPNAVH